MKVRLLLDVTELDRYLIARHFRRTELDGGRTRATRSQVRRFAEGALGAAIRDQAESARGRAKGVVGRLRDPQRDDAREVLKPADGWQPSLW